MSGIRGTIGESTRSWQGVTEVHFKGGPLDGQSRVMHTVTAKYVVTVTRVVVEECHDLATDELWEVQRDEVSQVEEYVYWLRVEYGPRRLSTYTCRR